MVLRWQSALLAAVACLVAANPMPGRADGNRASEASVKAAIVFNSLLFVNWRPRRVEPTPTLRLCIVEDPATSAVLYGMVGQLVGKARLVFVENPLPEGLISCDAIFVGGNNPSALYRMAVTTRGQQVLIMGEGPLAIENGAMIGLILVGDRYVIDVNLAALRREEISVSSKLLRLARRVME